MPVGSYATNGFGLYDMAGNVWEWVNDLCQEDYCSSSPAQDPPGPSEGNGRVMRGGSWRFDYPGDLRCSGRGGYGPVSRYDFIGFRCVREVIP